MTPFKSGIVTVPGATLYYQQAGRGPLLLVLSGGTGDADLGELGEILAADFTVLSYDRRGYSRSPLADKDAVGIIDVATQGDDAHRLLAEVTQEPAIAVGISLGALIGLDLVAKHPEQVKVLVAHEPPAHALVPETERPPLPSAGPDGLRKYAQVIGVSQPSAVFASRPQESAERRAANARHFVACEAPAARTFLPDFDKLGSAGARVVLAAGESSRGFAPYRYASIIARRLGSALVEFPGDHGGPMATPNDFAAKLKQVLATH
jgi:pimeloyl-ACP methyl ester carboxylesterase